MKEGFFRQLGRDFRDRLGSMAVREASGGNRVKIYFDADMVYGSQLAAIGGARERILMEMYMFRSDTVGWMFAKALAERAKDGLEVRLIYDAVGSSDADESVFDFMREAGVFVVKYRPLGFFRKGSGFISRDHRKILVCDGEVGFVGGVNTGDFWSRTVSGDDAWRDTHMRVVGSAAADLQLLTAEVWKVATGDNLILTENDRSREGRVSILVVGSRGWKSRRIMRDLFVSELDAAQHSVELTMPYFMPTRKIRKALLNAAKRGVRIDLLVPRDSDITIADMTRDGIYPQLQEAGIVIWEYLGPILHAKSAVIDGHIGIVGSSNFDFLSFAMNREVVVVLDDDQTVLDLQLQFMDDLILSDKVTARWEESRSLLRRGTSCFLAWLLKWLF